MIVKASLVGAALVLLVLGVRLAAEEGDFASEYEVFTRMMTAQARLPDTETLAAASIVSRFEDNPPPASLHREVLILERMISMSAGQVTQPIEGRITATARKLAAQVPTSGFAWCALSAAAARQRWEPAAMERTLTRCHDTFPYELSYVATRLRQAVLLWPLLSASSRERAMADLDKLLRSKANGVRMAESMARLVATVAPERGDDFARVVAANDNKIQTVYRTAMEYAVKEHGR